mmetsp:Transcript_28562/g.53980  ORF Transcript_28562/g.53980 Transcript_28562/m.53980 type:complete len:217 (+) Transcript_28562:620-1270(+)
MGIVLLRQPPKHGLHIRQIFLRVRPNLWTLPQRARISMRLPQNVGFFYHQWSLHHLTLLQYGRCRLLPLGSLHILTNRLLRRRWRHILVIHNSLPNTRNALRSNRIYAIYLSQKGSDAFRHKRSTVIVREILVGEHEELSAFGILFHPVGNEIFVVRELIGEAVGWRVAVIYPGFVGAAGRVGGEMVLVFILQIKIARHSIDRIPQNYHSPTKKRV